MERKIKNVEQARAFSLQHTRMQKKIEKYFVPKIFNALKEQINEFLKAIERHGYQYAKGNIFSIVSPLPVAKAIKELYHKSAHLESNFVLNSLRRRKKGNSFDFEVKRSKPKLGLGFEELAPVIDSYFQIYLLNNSALPITATTRKIIVNHLINEVDRGVPLLTAIENFTDLAITGGAPLALSRAVMISKTESTRALSFGGLIGAYMSGVDVDKVWVTSEDEKVRGATSIVPFPHTALDLQEADMMGSFYNGENIKFPGDPDASIENTVNCRCAMFFKEKSRPENIGQRLLSNFLNDFYAGVLIGVATELINEDN